MDKYGKEAAVTQLCTEVFMGTQAPTAGTHASYTPGCSYINSYKFFNNIDTIVYNT